MLVNCKFIDENNIPKGRTYLYQTDDDLVQGEIVITEDLKKVIAIEIDVTSDFTGNIKKVSRMEHAPAEQVEFEGFADGELMIPELTIDSENIAIIEQLPIISEQLDLVSTQIDDIVQVALALPCNESTRKEIKKIRAKLNGVYKEFEAKRILISKEVNKPYEMFNAKYKACVGDKIVFALEQIDKATNKIETGLKDELAKVVKAYFKEYADSLNLDWVTWEMSKIRVGLSDNKTALTRDVTKFLDQIAQDMVVIETQTAKNEIEVEYRKTLNLASSIKIVNDRNEQIKKAEEKRKQIEAERLRLQQQAQEQKPQVPQNVPLQKPQEVIVSPTKVADIPKPSPAEAPVTTPDPLDRVGSVCFKVTGTLRNVQKIKQFLLDNGYQFEQIPIKNIIREDAI